MKNIYVLLFFIFVCRFLSAQQIEGIVIDAQTQAPLVHASIRVNDTQVAQSDEQGKFSIPCQGNTTIDVAYIGYEAVRQSVACPSSSTITLSLTAQLLNPVTVSSSQNKSILYQPASVAQIGNTELKRGNGLYLDDAINANIPGVIMQRRTNSAGQTFNIRGYGNGARGTNGASSNFDTQGTKVYLNNIPITDAEGITLMDDIDFDAVENVEVVKGPVGSLYGLAIAGAVNLKTIMPQAGKSSVSQEAMGGSYGLRRYTTRLQVGNERSAFLVSYGRQLYDGFMRHTASHKDFVNVVGEFKPNAKQQISTYFGFSDSYDQRNGELTVKQYNTGDYSGNNAYVANDAHSNVTSFRGGITHQYQLNKSIANTTTLFGTGITSNVSSAGGWTDKLPVNAGLRSVFNLGFALSNQIQLSGLIGVEAQRQQAQTIGYSMTDPTGKTNDPTNYLATGNYNYIGSQTSNVYTISKTISTFTEWTLTLPQQLSFTAGVGFSNMGIQLNNRMPVTASNQTRTVNGSYDNMVSPRFAINKVFNQHFSVYASYSTGYKAPVSSYFYIPLTGQLNTDLKAESGSQFEIGSKGSLLSNKLEYQVALFSTLFKNKMTVVAVPNATNTATSYSYVANGGEQKHLGAELSLKYTAYQSQESFVKWVQFFGNLTAYNFKYGSFKFQQLSGDKKSNVETDYTGKRVAGVPSSTYNLGVDCTTRIGLFATMNYNYRGSVYFVSPNEITSADATNNPTNQAQADAFALLNAKVGYQKNIGAFDIKLYAAANNITSTQYYQMLFVNQLPDAFLPGPKNINYFYGIQLKYAIK